MIMILILNYYDYLQLHFLSELYDVGFSWQNLLNVADALILNFERLVNSFERQFNDVLDVGPLGICLKSTKF